MPGCRAPLLILGLKMATRKMYEIYESRDGYQKFETPCGTMLALDEVVQGKRAVFLSTPREPAYKFKALVDASIKRGRGMYIAAVGQLQASH